MGMVFTFGNPPRTIPAAESIVGLDGLTIQNTFSSMTPQISQQNVAMCLSISGHDVLLPVIVH